MSTLNIEQARFNMIEQQVRPWDVLDPKILDVLNAVPREQFAPAKHSALAFSDLNIPLGHGQVMMPPRLEGRMMQSLQIEPTHTVLEVGTGSGYVTACLAKLARRVVSIDVFADFQNSARTKLAQAGISNVNLQEQDAAAGWSGKQEFDAIAVTGSLPVMHEGFHESLTIGGRLFVIVGKHPIMEAKLFTRVGQNEWMQESMFETSIPALLHASEPDKFVF